MKREENKSRCPINYTMEIFGDSWSLLIVRDIVTFGKKTFGEFLDSKERIGPSVLSERLALLERKGVLSKNPSTTDKRKFEYSLTGKGMALLPVVYEIAVWGSLNSPNRQAPDVWFKALELDREVVLQLWREAVQCGDSFYTGPNSVVAKLGLSAR